MRKRLIPLVFLAIACASASPQKIPGRYAVVFDPRMDQQERRAIPSVSQSILRGLNDRFASIEVAPSMKAPGYDGIIGIQYGGGNLFGYSSSETTISRFTIIEYEIHRPSRDVIRGNTRIGGLIRGEGYVGQSSTVKEALEIGIEVARVIAKEIASS